MKEQERLSNDLAEQQLSLPESKATAPDKQEILRRIRESRESQDKTPSAEQIVNWVQETREYHNP